MRTSDFDYTLPAELIAAEPAAERGGSRLLIMSRESASIEHRRFTDLPRFLREGDVLVLNDSRVIRARLRGRRAETGGALELLLLERVKLAHPGDCWLVMARPAKKLKRGDLLLFGTGDLRAEVLESREEGERVIRFDVPDVLPVLDRIGEMPLPPYILHRRREMAADPHAFDAEDDERYQTVYANEAGSVAAPTAGLHFSESMLETLQCAGVQIAKVTLHVGAGTFKPVEVDNPAQHPMHLEHYSVPIETADAVNAALRDGRRVIAVGTTAVRTLESAFHPELKSLVAGSGSTRMLILPGYEFRVVNGLLTNFHLPRSTLLMLVSAFAGKDNVLRAYEEAIEQRYRFYSYGDAMFIT